MNNKDGCAHKVTPSPIDTTYTGILHLSSSLVPSNYHTCTVLSNYRMCHGIFIKHLLYAPAIIITFTF